MQRYNRERFDAKILVGRVSFPESKHSPVYWKPNFVRPMSWNIWIDPLCISYRCGKIWTMEVSSTEQSNLSFSSKSWHTEAPVVLKMNLAKLTTAFLGKGTIFNYQFTHNYIRETLLPLFKSRKFAPRENAKKNCNPRNFHVTQYVWVYLNHNHFLFHKAYLVVPPETNLACRQRPLHPLLSLGILQGAIKYFLLK